MHTGVAELRDGDYYGTAVNRAARLMSVAHGGQVVVSAVTSELVRGGSVELLDLGEHRLRDLGETERVFQVVHPELEHEFPALRSVDERGREPAGAAEPVRGPDPSIAQVSGLVSDTAVVTLTGPGGVGKTRLALQVAAVLRPSSPDGAWFVDLAPVNDPERVAAVVLETLGYTLAAGEDDVTGLCTRLRRRKLLLVIDNCEHLVASAATVVDAISTSAPDVRVVATSREGLGVPAERVVPVTPLATDAAGDAVELFETRARAARPDVRARCGDDRDGGRVVPASRRDPARDRAGGGPDAVDGAGADPRATRRTLPDAHGREPHRGGAPSDVAGRGRLVLRAALRRRARGARSAVGVRGRVHARCGGDGRE